LQPPSAKRRTHSAQNHCAVPRIIPAHEQEVTTGLDEVGSAARSAGDLRPPEGRQEMFSDNAKTYIQLSGAALTLTLTFAEKILHIPPEKSIVNFWTIAIWSCFLVTIITGSFYQYLAVKQLDAWLDW
jgi:hypothetical protein